ncbi:hypothetical protein WA026_017168 [Henosepilachna vigintioctopunctata]|uniref:Uncharacterized protein n=1 Tax=Henosepilachna vigintioctopunctata TaxID=420089 RepID=A0AAW1UG27_9CUCU
MKWIISLFFIFCVVYGQDVEKVEIGIVQQFFEKRCYKHSTSGDAYDKLVVLSDDFRKYAQYTSTFLPDHIGHFCKNERDILINKMKDVNKQMLLCLPKEEKFLPQYVQDTITSFLQFLCQDGGTNVKSFFSSQGKQCRTSLSYNNATEEVGSCFSRVFKTVRDNEYMTKTNLCSDVGLVKGCFSAALDKYCSGFAAFQALNNVFFRYINKPCSACIFGINNLFIYLSVAVSLLYSKFA